MLSNLTKKNSNSAKPATTDSTYQSQDPSSNKITSDSSAPRNESYVSSITKKAYDALTGNSQTMDEEDEVDDTEYNRRFDADPSLGDSKNEYSTEKKHYPVDKDGVTVVDMEGRRLDAHKGEKFANYTYSSLVDPVVADKDVDYSNQELKEAAQRKQQQEFDTEHANYDASSSNNKKGGIFRRLSHTSSHNKSKSTSEANEGYGLDTSKNIYSKEDADFNTGRGEYAEEGYQDEQIFQKSNFVPNDPKQFKGSGDDEQKLYGEGIPTNDTRRVQDFANAEADPATYSGDVKTPYDMKADTDKNYSSTAGVAAVGAGAGVYGMKSTNDSPYNTSSGVRGVVPGTQEKVRDANQQFASQTAHDNPKDFQQQHIPGSKNVVSAGSHAHHPKRKSLEGTHGLVPGTALSMDEAEQSELITKQVSHDNPKDYSTFHIPGTKGEGRRGSLESGEFSGSKSAAYGAGAGAGLGAIGGGMYSSKSRKDDGLYDSEIKVNDKNTDQPLGAVLNNLDDPHHKRLDHIDHKDVTSKDVGSGAHHSKTSSGSEGGIVEGVLGYLGLKGNEAAVDSSDMPGGLQKSDAEYNDKQFGTHGMNTKSEGRSGLEEDRLNDSMGYVKTRNVQTGDSKNYDVSTGSNTYGNSTLDPKFADAPAESTPYRYVQEKSNDATLTKKNATNLTADKNMSHNISQQTDQTTATPLVDDKLAGAKTESTPYSYVHAHHDDKRLTKTDASDLKVDKSKSIGVGAGVAGAGVSGKFADHDSKDTSGTYSQGQSSSTKDIVDKAEYDSTGNKEYGATQGKGYGLEEDKYANYTEDYNDFYDTEARQPREVEYSHNYHSGRPPLPDQHEAFIQNAQIDDSTAVGAGAGAVPQSKSAQQLSSKDTLAGSSKLTDKFDAAKGSSSDNQQPTSAKDKVKNFFKKDSSSKQHGIQGQYDGETGLENPNHRKQATGAAAAAGVVGAGVLGKQKGGDATFGGVPTSGTHKYNYSSKAASNMESPYVDTNQEEVKVKPANYRDTGIPTRTSRTQGLEQEQTQSPNMSAKTAPAVTSSAQEGIHSTGKDFNKAGNYGSSNREEYNQLGSSSDANQKQHLFSTSGKPVKVEEQVEETVMRTQGEGKPPVVTSHNKYSNTYNTTTDQLQSGSELKKGSRVGDNTVEGVGSDVKAERHASEDSHKKGGFLSKLGGHKDKSSKSTPVEKTPINTRGTVYTETHNEMADSSYTSQSPKVYHMKPNVVPGEVGVGMSGLQNPETHQNASKNLREGDMVDYHPKEEHLEQHDGSKKNILEKIKDKL